MHDVWPCSGLQRLLKFQGLRLDRNYEWTTTGSDGAQTNHRGVRRGERPACACFSPCERRAAPGAPDIHGDSRWALPLPPHVCTDDDDGHYLFITTRLPTVSWIYVHCMDSSWKNKLKTCSVLTPKCRGVGERGNKMHPTETSLSKIHDLLLVHMLHSRKCFPFRVLLNLVCT